MSDKSNIKNRAFSGVIWKFSERICAQVVSLVVSIILARILMPDDYSVVSIVTIFFTFSNVIISGGLSTALIQKKEADIVDYSSVLYISMLMAGVMYLIMFFTAPYIAALYNKDILVLVIRVMGLIFFINAFKSVVCAYVSSNLQFRMFFWATLIGTVVSAGVGITMAVSGFGPWALVAQQMTNSFIDTVILTITTKFKPVFSISWKKLKSLFDYGWKVFVSSIISVIYDQLNPLIVGVKFSSTSLAYYNKGMSFPSMLNSSICETVSSVAFPVISKVQDDNEKVLAITRRFMKLSSYVVFPLMVGFFAVSDSFITILLTDKWSPAIPFVKIFCISYMFNIIQTGNLQVIRAIGRSDILLILEIVKKVFYFVVIALFVWFTDSPEMLAVSSIVCTGIASMVNSYPNRKLIGYKYRYQISDLLPNLAIAFIMGGAVYAMRGLNLTPMILLIVQIVMGMAIYVGISVITRNENFKYILHLLLNIVKGMKKI